MTYSCIFAQVKACIFVQDLYKQMDKLAGCKDFGESYTIIFDWETNLVNGIYKIQIIINVISVLAQYGHDVFLRFD